MPDIASSISLCRNSNGIMLARRLATMLNVRLLMMTLHEDRAYLKQAMDAGVRGYVLKRSAAENWSGLNAVVVGGLYVDPALVARVRETQCSFRCPECRFIPNCFERSRWAEDDGGRFTTRKCWAHRRWLKILEPTRREASKSSASRRAWNWSHTPPPRDGLPTSK